MLGIAEQGAVEVERQRPSLEIKRSSQQALTPNQTPDTAFSETEAEPAPLSVDERPLWKLFNAGRIDDLEAEIEHLRREYPGWEPPKTLVQLMQPKPAADTGLGPAWELFNQGKTAQAESRFRSALDKHPANTEARYGLALILFQQKRLADADRLLAGSKVDRDRALLADIRMARARHAHQAGHYRQSNRWLRQVRALGAGGREAVLFSYW